MDLESVYREANQREDQPGPSCEVEESSSTGNVSQPAGGHRNSTAEIEDLEN